jgi:hypothetical protein
VALDTAATGPTEVSEPPPADAPAVDHRSLGPPDWLALAFFFAIAMVFTLPVWPSEYGRSLPGDSGDALLNLWILEWAGHHLFSGWEELWNTSIFWPHDRTLAYSESMLPVAAVHRVLSALLGSGVLAFNVIYVAAWTLSGWITYLLAKRLSRSTAGALVAGLVYTVATPRLAHYGHFQLAMGFLVPLVLLLVLRFFEAPSLGRGAALGLATGGLALSTSYYGLMTLVALAVLVPGLVIWTWRNDDRAAVLGGLAVAAVVGAAIVVPVAWQYRELQEDPHFRRDPDPNGYAQLEDFLRVTPDHYLLSDLPPFESRSRPESTTVERRLYPGFLAAALGVAGFVVVISQRRKRPGDPRASARLLVLLVPAGLLVLVLAFGDRLNVNGTEIWMPYSWLHDVPGFSGIRATARFVAFPLLVLACLAAVGLGALLSRVRPRWARVAVTVLALGVVGAESLMAIATADTPRNRAGRAVNEALARREAGPVLELPIGSPADGWPWGYIETPRQYLSRIDGYPRVSGYSGFAPPDFDTTAAILERFPGEDAFALLDELGVRYVLLRTGIPNGLTDLQAATVALDGVGRYAEARARDIIEALPEERVARVDRIGDAWLVELD